MVSHSPPRGGGSRYDPRGQYTLIREMKGVAVKAEREGKSRLKKMAKARGGKFQVGYSSGEQDRAGKEYSPLGYRLTKKIQSIIGKQHSPNRARQLVYLALLYVILLYER